MTEVSLSTPPTPVELPTHKSFRNLTGMVVWRLTVVSFAGMRKTPRGKSVAWWNCTCECGGAITVRSDGLLEAAKGEKASGVKSCGCLRRESVAAVGRANKTHGENPRIGERSPLYSIWNSMKQRCCNPKTKAYASYGGRGITVCDRWNNDFSAFREDVGEPPTPQHSLDRIDNDDGYRPGNVRWATRTEQARNRRTNRLIEWHGVTKTLVEWGEITGITSDVLSARLKAGCDVNEAMTTAVSPRIHRIPSLIEWHAENRSLSEWSRITGIRRETLRARLEAGWSVERSFTTPVEKRCCRSRAEPVE